MIWFMTCAVLVSSAVVLLAYRMRVRPSVRLQRLLDAYFAVDTDEAGCNLAKSGSGFDASKLKIYAILGVSTIILVLNIKLGIAFLALTYLIVKRKTEKNPRFSDREIFENLPLELENIIMVVQAGNDLIQTLKKISNPEFETSKLRIVFTDVLNRFSSGMDIGHAIDSVKEKYNNPKLSFVLSYLKISLKQGGEVMSQLRELADAVTSQYQNYIEKEINKMPAKALFPLMIILMGMLIIYLSGPLVLVSNQLPKVRETFQERT